MKLTSRYEQTSCRLELEGLPDVSAGQGDQSLGILTGFSLALAGHTELEGKREHLQALLQVVMPYARHLLSGVARPFGDEVSPVLIAPHDQGHQLMLRSSQPNTEPLTLQLDDAELADLVRCLDLRRRGWSWGRSKGTSTRASLRRRSRQRTRSASSASSS